MPDRDLIVARPFADRLYYVTERDGRVVAGGYETWAAASDARPGLPLVTDLVGERVALPPVGLRPPGGNRA